MANQKSQAPKADEVSSAEKGITLNFKVAPEFKKEFKGFAVAQGISMTDLLKEGFALLKSAGANDLAPRDTRWSVGAPSRERIMTLDTPEHDDRAADWLFTIGAEHRGPVVDGLVEVSGFRSRALFARASGGAGEGRGLQGASSSFSKPHITAVLQSPRHSFSMRSIIPMMVSSPSSRACGVGAVSSVYRAAPGSIQLFRCAHQPDFQVRAKVRSAVRSEPFCLALISRKRMRAPLGGTQVGFAAARSGMILTHASSCFRPKSSAARKLVEAVRSLAEQPMSETCSNRACVVGSLSSRCSSLISKNVRYCSRKILRAHCPARHASSRSLPTDRRLSRYWKPSKIASTDMSSV